MGVFDDYQDDMDRLSPRDIEAILSGRDVEDPGAEAFAALVKDMRRDLLEDPAPVVAARHLAAIKEAAREAEGQSAVSTQTRRRLWMRIRGQRRAAALAAGATLALGAGIAAAVTLPDQASDTAKEAVSNANGDASTNAEHGKAVSDTARNTSLQGCEKGQAVADQASGGQRQGPEQDPCAQGSGGGGGSSQGGGGDNGAGVSQAGSGGGSGGPGGGGGGGGSDVGSGGGSGGSGGGGGGGSERGSGGGSGGPEGGSGSGGPGTIPVP